MIEFWNWWQHIPERLDPVIFAIGSFRLQYYGLMYLVAFGVTYALAIYRLKTEPGFSIEKNQAADLMTMMILGLVIGARLGYVLFYNLAYYARHPLEIVLPFSFSNGCHFTGISGMSFHGGLIGVIIAAGVYLRKARLGFREAADLFIPGIPLGYTFGRLGNFINGELFGRTTREPFGMFFPQAGDHVLRHPSQLYEAFFEGLFLFCVLWRLRKVPLRRGAMLALYLIGYGTIRFFIEFFREPDPQIGFVLGPFSMGQLLCATMVLGGALLFVLLPKEKRGSA
jgi:phosphatidylglycerol:prolipoprotein diacylglycerol transferase